MAPVAGVPAGAPAGAAAGTPAGNKAGQRTTLTDADRDIGGGARSDFGTRIVGGTLYADTVRVESVRFVARGLQNKPPSSATLNVIANVGEDTTQFPGDEPPDDLFLDDTGATSGRGGFEISGAGATVEVNPDKNLFTGKSYHHFSVAQRGNTLGTGTLTTELTVVHEV